MESAIIVDAVNDCFINAAEARDLTITKEEDIIKKYTNRLMDISITIEKAAKDGRRSVYIDMKEIEKEINNLPDMNGFINFIQIKGYDIEVLSSADGRMNRAIISW